MTTCVISGQKIYLANIRVSKSQLFGAKRCYNNTWLRRCTYCVIAGCNSKCDSKQEDVFAVSQMKED